MSGTIVTAVETARDLEDFVALPYALHRGDPCWTPALRRDVRALLTPGKNPYWEHAERGLFAARAGGRVVGRVAAIADRLHQEAHGDDAGFFGFFESIDDPAVAGGLFEAASKRTISSAQPAPPRPGRRCFHLAGHIEIVGWRFNPKR